jgi:hypothetical protein
MARDSKKQTKSSEAPDTVTIQTKAETNCTMDTDMPSTYLERQKLENESARQQFDRLISQVRSEDELFQLAQDILPDEVSAAVAMLGSFPLFIAFLNGSVTLSLTHLEGGWRGRGEDGGRRRLHRIV